MKKVLSLLVLGMFVIGFSAPTFANTTTGTAQPKVQKEGLKQGLKMVLNRDCKTVQRKV